MKKIILLSIFVVFAMFFSGCGGQLLVMPEVQVHFSGNFAPDGYWYGVYRLPKILGLNGTSYRIIPIVDNKRRQVVNPAEEFSVVVNVFPGENRALSLSGIVINDEGKPIGVVRPQVITASMWVNSSQSYVWTIQKWDLIFTEKEKN